MEKLSSLSPGLIILGPNALLMLYKKLYMFGMDLPRLLHSYRRGNFSTVWRSHLFWHLCLVEILKIRVIAIGKGKAYELFTWSMGDL